VRRPTRASAATEARLRYRSPAIKISPLTARNTAATIGLPDSNRNGCSATRPTSPTGMVARTIIHASRWSTVSTRRSRMELKNPPMIRTQSRQK
jgi:hypothetical protein